METRIHRNSFIIDLLRFLGVEKSAGTKLEESSVLVL